MLLLRRRVGSGVPAVSEEAKFLDDAPWDKCAHGNYEFKCVGCWEALIGQARKADVWCSELVNVRALVRELATELAILTPEDRDDRQLYLLEQADETVRRLFG